jgi:hypothetical protein
MIPETEILSPASITIHWFVSIVDADQPYNESSIDLACPAPIASLP